MAVCTKIIYKKNVRLIESKVQVAERLARLAIGKGNHLHVVQSHQCQVILPGRCTRQGATPFNPSHLITRTNGLLLDLSAQGGRKVALVWVSVYGAVSARNKCVQTAWSDPWAQTVIVITCR